MKHLSLFSGIGGIDLAAEWAGFETVYFVEIDPYCQKVLRKHWPDTPIIGDIKDVTKETIADTTRQQAYQQCEQYQYREPSGQPRESLEKGQKTLRQKDGQTSNNNTSRLGKGRGNGNNTEFPITLITGGFPCQPVSGAGKRTGKGDDRWLWPEMVWVIS